MNVGFKLLPIQRGKRGWIYSPLFEGEDTHEFDRFMSDTEVQAAPDFGLILARLADMADKYGFQERFFRAESAFSNSVMALSAGGRLHRLRLYCCRWGESTLILGTGGIKRTEIKRYQEDPFLNACVEDMEYIDGVLQESIVNARLIRVSQDGELIGNLNFEDHE